MGRCFGNDGGPLENTEKHFGYGEILKTQRLRAWGFQRALGIAMVNETLCKILCHNLVVLIHEICELGIDPVFWPNSSYPLITHDPRSSAS